MQYSVELAKAYCPVNSPQILSVLLWHIPKNIHMTSGKIYTLSCTLFQKQSPGVFYQEFQHSCFFKKGVLIKMLSRFTGIWGIEVKNKKIPEKT